MSLNPKGTNEMTTDDKEFDLISIAQYMGISTVFEHLVNCEECRKKSYEIIKHANDEV
jgi:predicted anti-sigma-YlaC factor YlaD